MNRLGSRRVHIAGEVLGGLGVRWAPKHQASVVPTLSVSPFSSLITHCSIRCGNRQTDGETHYLHNSKCLKAAAALFMSMAERMNYVHMGARNTHTQTKYSTLITQK